MMGSLRHTLAAFEGHTEPSLLVAAMAAVIAAMHVSSSRAAEMVCTPLLHIPAPSGCSSSPPGSSPVAPTALRVTIATLNLNEKGGVQFSVFSIVRV